MSGPGKEQKPLVQWRLLAGLSLRELSEKAGVAHNQINLIELGRTTKPYGKTMKKIADALGLEIMQIEEFAEYIEGKPVAGQGPSRPATGEFAEVGASTSTSAILV